MTDPAIRTRFHVATAAAIEVGELALSKFRSPALDVTLKPDGSPVTDVDKRGETLIRERVARAFPDDGFLGEELPPTPSRSGYRWIIDPIDGTRSFAAGVPTFAVLIGVQDIRQGDEGPILAGVAHFPALAETVLASVASGCVWRSPQGERTCLVRTPTPPPVGASPLASATIEAASPRSFLRRGHWDKYRALADSCSSLRGWNDAYSFALLVTGRSDGLVGLGFSAWDVSPYVVMCAEAGAQMTSWSGENPLHAGTVIAASPTIWPHLAAWARA
jgi:fructose-1,6-bisphosphatase/inositol monophosphatase family enzyme